MHAHTHTCMHTHVHTQGSWDNRAEHRGCLFFIHTKPKANVSGQVTLVGGPPPMTMQRSRLLPHCGSEPCGFKAALVPSCWHVEGWSGEACVESFRCCSWKMEFSLWHSPWPDLVTWLTVREARECRWASTRICQHCQMLHSIRQRWCI